MEELKDQIQVLSEKWEMEIETLKNENKKLKKKLADLKDVLLTFEKVCKKIRTEE